MNEDQQPVWVESDGVSNLPTVAGVYRMRVPSARYWSGKRYCFFDGSAFHSYTDTPAGAMNESGFTTGFEDGEMNAWWDYQSLMAKPQAKVTTVEKCAEEFEQNPAWFVTASDEPAVRAYLIAKRAPAPEPEKVIVGGLTIDMADLVEFLKTKQPKPEPNTTPRGILTMWNESADHRLGMWRTME